jgi:GNAT superfamily N-acetyltransferase
MNPQAQPFHPAGLTLREQLWPKDEETVSRIVASSGFFSRGEIVVAEELVRERRRKGLASGYEFLFAEPPGSTAEHPLTLAYGCYGEIACTVGSYDLFWIAVDSDQRGEGIGRWLLSEIEAKIQRKGGRRLYIETSGRPQYDPTRRFYLSCGFTLAASFPEFYGPEDSKEVYCKKLD